MENPPELNLVYTLRAYQPYEAGFPDEHYKFLGPSVYDRKEPPFDFVKGDRPVVYISLGTVLKGAASFFQTCIEAFRGEEMDVIISEALVHGVPMVVIPFVSDQPVNAHWIEGLGVGKRLAYADVTKDTLNAAVRAVLTDPEIKENLAQVREWIRQAPGNPGGARAIIAYFKEKHHESF